jgi:hypothetical protein
MSNLSYVFVHALAKVSIELIDLFSLFRNFQQPNWRNVSRRQSQVLKRQIQMGIQVMYFKGHIASQSFALVQYFTQSRDSVLSWIFQKVLLRRLNNSQATYSHGFNFCPTVSFLISSLVPFYFSVPTQEIFFLLKIQRCLDPLLNKIFHKARFNVPTEFQTFFFSGVSVTHISANLFYLMDFSVSAIPFAQKTTKFWIS